MKKKKIINPCHLTEIFPALVHSSIAGVWLQHSHELSLLGQALVHATTTTNRSDDSEKPFAIPAH